MSLADPSLAGAAAPAGSGAGAPLPERPPISAPAALRRPADVAAERRRTARQPGLGLVGLVLVVPIAALLAIGAGGANDSVLVLAPLVTFGLPALATVAFWWDDWPGTRLRASWSGWADTVLIIAAAVVLTGVGQAIAGGLDLRGIFDPAPGPGHMPTFPATMPLAGAAFVAMLQLTLVGEGWPLRRLPALPAGAAALAVAWVVALIVYFTLAGVDPPPSTGLTPRDGPVAGVDLGAALVLIGAWQVLFYVVWRGWPFSAIGPRAARLGCAHAVVLAAGVANFLLGRHGLGFDDGDLGAAAGCFVAAGLLVGMLLEGAVEPRLRDGAKRTALLAATLALCAALGAVLGVVAGALSFARATPEDWVEHVALNALAISPILHVAVGRRWPFAPPAEATA